ncbi:MAG TPA: sigma-54-dependent Fis family transcriptional regulator, partial [Vicinamibacteria bacterium]|nr:sigma-54-dependent Fis family transcriptional regulator [Vicinamibacteria bacterium]
MTAIAPAALARLEAHSWPGNVRELRNAVERAMLLAEGSSLCAEDFAGVSAGDQGGEVHRLPAGGVRFEDLERDLVFQALERASWNKA